MQVPDADGGAPRNTDAVDLSEELEVGASEAREHGASAEDPPGDESTDVPNGPLQEASIELNEADEVLEAQNDILVDDCPDEPEVDVAITCVSFLNGDHVRKGWATQVLGLLCGIVNVRWHVLIAERITLACRVMCKRETSNVLLNLIWRQRTRREAAAVPIVTFVSRDHVQRGRIIQVQGLRCGIVNALWH